MAFWYPSTGKSLVDSGKRPTSVLTNEKLCIQNPSFSLSTTRRSESVASTTISREIAMFLLKFGNKHRYAGGSQHTRRSSLPAPTRQIQPSSRNLNNISGEGGTRSSAAHGERCWGDMGKS